MTSSNFSFYSRLAIGLAILLAVIMPAFFSHAQLTTTLRTDGTNIGIGTTGPTQVLQVSGNVASTALAGDGSALASLPNANGWTDSGIRMHPSVTTDNVGIGTTTPNAATLELVKTAAQPVLKISSSAAGNGNFLTMGSQGNVGLGTTSFFGGTAIMNGNVGLGTLTPNYRLRLYNPQGTGDSVTPFEIQANGSINMVMISADDTSSLYPRNIYYRSRGTMAAKSVVQSNNYLMSSYYTGYDGSANRVVGCITYEVDNTAGAGDMPTRIELHTQLDGAATILESNTPRIVIRSPGTVGVGTASPISGFITMNGNMGIGTFTSINKLSVMGNIGVGTTLPYLEIPATLNGMLVEGNVGIGTWDPTEKLHVVGNLLVQGSTSCTLGNGAGGTNCSSDSHLKENVREISNSLAKILDLRGVEFDWNTKALKPGRHDIGVIAQEAEKVFPTTVVADANGYKMLDYAVLVAPLIEAVKKLKDEDDSQEKMIGSQDTDLASLQKINHGLEDDLAGIKTALCREASDDPLCHE